VLSGLNELYADHSIARAVLNKISTACVGCRHSMLQVEVSCCWPWRHAWGVYPCVTWSPTCC